MNKIVIFLRSVWMKNWKILVLVRSIWSAHISFWQWIYRSVFGWPKTPEGAQDAARFKDAWGWYNNPAWGEYDGTFEQRKNLMSEYFRANAQLMAKFTCWLFVTWGWVTLLLLFIIVR